MADKDDPFEHTRMTLGEHLEELRKRLFYSVLALTIAFGFAWWYKERVALAVLWPWRTAVAQINGDLAKRADGELLAYQVAGIQLRAIGVPFPVVKRSLYYTSDDPGNTQMRFSIDPRPSMFSVGEGFFFALNNSIYFACFAAGPVVLWQIWMFISAGLYKHEKRAVLKYFPFSVALFLIGVVFCYFFVIPVGMYFLASTLPVDQLKPQLGIDQYFSFLSTMCLAMGAVFQLPIVMVFFSRIGLIDPKTYGKYRGHFLVGALFVAGVVTPGPDYYSQILMTIPMYALYELGILIARLGARPRRHPEPKRAS
jgi:sec-independent protein translocase protein TatC